MKRARVRHHVAALALVLGAGCYRYVPTDMSSVEPGSEVRARLTPAGREEMTRLFGPEVRALDGELVRWNHDGIAVLKAMTFQVDGFPATRAADTLHLATAQFSEVERKELDGRRTVLFGAGIIAGMAGAVIAARTFGGDSEDPHGEGPDEQPEAAIILISIPLQIFR